MIYLIHGPDVVSSRTFLMKLKSGYQDHTIIDAKKSKNILSEISHETNIFGHRRLIILENYKPDEKVKIRQNKEIDIAIWNDDTTTPVSWVDKTVVFKEQPKANIFRYSDFVSYGQLRQAIDNLLILLDQKTQAEIIIGSLVRQMRLMSLVLDGESQEISKSSFVREKVKEQARNWTFPKIRKAVIEILKSDWEIKSGTISPKDSLVILTDKLCNLAKN